MSMGKTTESGESPAEGRAKDNSILHPSSWSSGTQKECPRAGYNAS